MTAQRPFTLPTLGLGLGWRRELASLIADRQGLGFVEVVTENVDTDGPLPRGLEALRRQGMTIVPHGVTLSLGSAERPDPERLSNIARLAERLGAPFVSEHICFVRADGLDSGHLLPVPHSQDCVEIVAENIQLAQAALPVPLVVENIATLFEWPDAEMTEVEFVTSVLQQADAPFLLDLSNLYANGRNHGFDAIAALDALPLERIAYCHVAGGVERHGVFHDTHAHALVEGAYTMVEELYARTEARGVLLERDDHFPEAAELNRELDQLLVAMERGRARREARRQSPAVVS